MKLKRHMARECLTNLPLASFWDVVREAKISDDDQVILDLRFVHGKSIQQIALITHLSQETVNRIIRRAYDKIANLI